MDKVFDLDSKLKGCEFNTTDVIPVLYHQGYCDVINQNSQKHVPAAAFPTIRNTLLGNLVNIKKTITQPGHLVIL